MCQWHTSCEPTEPAGETLAPCRGLGVSERQWRSSCEPTEPAGETSAPKVLPLTLEGGARNPKVAQNLTPTSQARQRQKAAPPNHPEQRKSVDLGKHSFSKSRRAAD